MNKTPPINLKINLNFLNAKSWVQARSESLPLEGRASADRRTKAKSLFNQELTRFTDLFAALDETFKSKNHGIIKLMYQSEDGEIKREAKYDFTRSETKELELKKQSSGDPASLDLPKRISLLHDGQKLTKGAIEDSDKYSVRYWKDDDCIYSRASKQDPNVKLTLSGKYEQEKEDLPTHFTGGKDEDSQSESNTDWETQGSFNGKAQPVDFETIRHAIN